MTSGDRGIQLIECTHDEVEGKRWGDPISERRQAELQARLDAWNAPQAVQSTSKGPFDGERLTGADVFYLAMLLNFQGPMLIGPLPLEGADLSEAHLEGAVLTQSHLEGVNLNDAHLEGAYLGEVHLNGAQLVRAHLDGAYLSQVRLGYAVLMSAHLDGADVSWAQAEGVYLSHAHLKNANLSFARLEGANLNNVHLEGANLDNVHLEGVDLSGAHLEGARLTGCWLESRSTLKGASVDHMTMFGDIHWGGVGAVDLTQIDWERVAMLGDERGVGLLAGAGAHAAVVRAYRQLATQLRAQGMTEVADRFAHRARTRERWAYLSSLLHDWNRPWRWPGGLLRYVGSAALALLAGYGFRPGRTLFWYVLTVLTFMDAYLLVTYGVPLFGLTEPSGTQPLHWYEALVLSAASFHGRGFFPQGINLGDPVAILAAGEAVIGLFVEISFIATFTQRYFAR
ncbi:MAG TPA: pentapeptide repeat-containing protein [Ktedonobacterales bacterium]